MVLVTASIRTCLQRNLAAVRKARWHQEKYFDSTCPLKYFLFISVAIIQMIRKGGDKEDVLLLHRAGSAGTNCANLRVSVRGSSCS